MGEPVPHEKHTILEVIGSGCASESDFGEPTWSGSAVTALIHTSRSMENSAAL